MSEFLYELDRKEIYEHSINQEQFNEEDFLNQRAYVLTMVINIIMISFPSLNH